MTLSTRELHRLFHQLVDIESVSRHEQALADAVDAALHTMPWLRVDRLGNSLVARTDLGRDTRVIIAGHLDTVPVKDNLPGRIEEHGGEEVLVGRGAADMKGGIAVMLHLATELDQPRHDVSWVFYECEEIEAQANGITRIVAQHPDWLTGDFAVLMEPTSAKIEGGCQGSIRFRLTSHGRSAHSARSWLGHNAIHDMTAALEVISGFEPREVDVEGLRYREGLNATTIHAGIAGNVVPDRCEMTVNYRFAPDLDASDALRDMQHRFDLPGVDFELQDLSPGARPGLERPAAREFCAAVGGTPGPKYGWTDVARFGALGIPAVNFGPGDAGTAHADNERCRVVELDRCAQALTDWLAPCAAEAS